MNIKKLCLAFICVIQASCAWGEKASFYYDGFWTYHRVSKSAELLKQSHNVRVDVSLSELSQKTKDILFSGYQNLSNIGVPDDFILLIEVHNDKNKMRRIIGSRDALYDTESGTYKILSDEQKDFIRCFLVKKNPLDPFLSDDVCHCIPKKDIN